MRKHLKALLAICLVLSLVCQIKPSTAVAHDDSFNVSGYTMSEDYYKHAYGSKPSDNKEAAVSRSGETKSTTDASISNIVVKDNAISLNINMGTTEENISVIGEMYASAKTQHGVNSIVVDAKCSDTAYEVLTFEIWNDSDEDQQVMYNTSIKNTPHVKLYLQNSNSDISAFEFPLPTALNDLDASDYEKADSMIDLLWPLKVVDATVTEVPTDDVILEELGLLDNSRAVNTWTRWINSKTYFHTFYNLASEYVSISLPYVDYKYSNVTSSGGPWIASFEVSEHTTVTNAYGTQTTYYGENAFRYRNVKLAFGCGDNTTFIRTFQQGRMIDTSMEWLGQVVKEQGAKIMISALKTAVSEIPVASEYFDVVEFLLAMEPISKEVELGSTGTTLFNSPIVAAGKQLANKYYISECTDQGGVENVGDYFTYHADLNYENAGGNTNTVGVLNIAFDVCIEVEEVDGYPKSRSTNIELNYSANP